MMQSLLGDLPYVLIYLDDILIASKDNKEHLEHLKSVFNKLQQRKLYASNSKIKLLQKEVEFLGYLLTANRIASCPKKVEAIKHWPIPANMKQMQSLLGAFRALLPIYPKLCPNCTSSHMLNIQRSGIQMGCRMHQGIAGIERENDICNHTATPQPNLENIPCNGFL